MVRFFTADGYLVDTNAGTREQVIEGTPTGVAVPNATAPISEEAEESNYYTKMTNYEKWVTAIGVGSLVISVVSLIRSGRDS